MPEYVKCAEVTTAEDVKNLHPEVFADGVNKKFALNTKANCWCSALYYYGNQCNNYPVGKQAEAKLLSAARIWGITDDVAKVKQAFEQQDIPATYAISFEYKGHKVERCPDHTKEAATASAEWLFANRYRFPTSIQKNAAERLMAKADILGLTPKASNYLDRLSNPDSYTNVNCKVALAITDRLKAVPTGKWVELEDELFKVANDLNSKPFELCTSSQVIATALEAMDIKHGLTTKWGSALQHPVDVCFRASMTKAAAATSSTIHLTTGTPVDLTKISDHQLEKGLKIAGDDFLAYCQPDGFNLDRAKAAEILPTLPKPDAKRFEAAVKSAGYIPETTYDLIDRAMKQSDDHMPAPTAADVPQPEMWEDNQAFDNRMQGKKEQAKQLSEQAKAISEQAKLENLDAQAGIAASKARQARQAQIVSPGSPQPPTQEQQGQQ